MVTGDRKRVCATIYAPNDPDAQHRFYLQLNNTLQKFSSDSIILGGDFNYPLSKEDKHYGTAPVDPCRPQNRGSHYYLRAHKGSRRMLRPLIQDSSVRVLFPRYKGNLT